MKPPFRLYPEERHWWSFNDYGAVLDAMAKLTEAGRPIARVLEFGPGSSTLALIEGGATTIDSCEDDPAWAKTYEERLQAEYPSIVKIRRYTWAEPLTVPHVDSQRYHLALIDGPLGSDRRVDVMRYCLARCESVLLPTEDRNRRVREAIVAIADELGLVADIWDTGPLSGGFALLTRPDAAPPETPAPPQMNRRARRAKAKADPQ